MVGIIALLIGILLPTLNVARRQAQRTACSAKLHQIGLAMQEHAVTHRGFYPLAGWVPGWSPESLDDPYQAKYSYGPNWTGLPSPAGGGAATAGAVRPVTAALAVIMKAPVDAQSGDDGRGYMRSFLCPSQTDDPTDVAVPGYPVANGGAEPCQIAADVLLAGGHYFSQAGCSYVWSEYVLGWSTQFEPYASAADPHPQYAYARLRGKADKVHHPEQTFLAGDGNGSIARRWCWDEDPGKSLFGMGTIYNTAAPLGNSTYPSSTGPVTLDHALAGDALAGNPASFDLLRHGGYVRSASGSKAGTMNLLYCDGHCDAKAITPGSLATVYLVPPTP